MPATSPTFLDLAASIDPNLQRPIFLANGSAAAPSLGLVNSITTGLFRAAADVLGIATAGLERARYTDIGQYTFNLAASPASALTRWQILGTGVANHRFRFDSALVGSDNTFLDINPMGAGGAGTGPRLDFVASATRSISIASFLSAGDATFAISGTESAIHWTMTGASLSEHQLNSAQNGGGSSVFRTRYLQFGVNVDAVLQSIDVRGQVGTESAHPFDIITSDLQRLTVLATGEIGIGTTAPATPLHVVDNGALGFRLERTAATIRSYSLLINASGNLVLNDTTAAAQRFLMDTSGNTVFGSGSVIGFHRIQGNTLIDSTSTTAFRVMVSGAAGTPAITVDTSNFRVGINVSPGAALDVTQTAALSGNPIAVRFSGGAHTGLTAGANVISVDFRLDQTIQHATGAVALEETIRFSAPTYSFVAASTITECAFLSVTGSPTAGTNATITTAMALWIKAGGTGSFNTYFGATPSLGSGIGVIGIANAGTNPTVNPVGGGIMYVTGGAGTWRGSGGTVTTFGPAGPHCETCGYDMWEVAAINTRWRAWRFVCGNCGERFEGGPKNVLDRLDAQQKREILSKRSAWEDVSKLLGAVA